MALSKDITQPTGLTASYWRVVQTNVSDLTKSGRIKLLGYKNEQTRLDHPEEGHVDQHIEAVYQDAYDNYFAPSVLDASGCNRVKQAYQVVKDRAAGSEEHKLTDATDV